MAGSVPAGEFRMKAVVTVLNSSFQFARAQTINDLAIFFRLPKNGDISLSDELDLNLERLDVEQDVRNLTTGARLRLKIESFSVKDLRSGNGGFQVPALSRRRGG